jgi:hypothetical protein
MKTKVLILALLFLVCCEKEKKIPVCPTCSEEVSWEESKGEGRYGEWVIGEAGYDGSWDAVSTLNLKRDCGWKILGDNVGGYGKKYIIYSCDTAVVFTWAWGMFLEISLREGWIGSTKEGIRMGDDLTTFLKKYPYFKPVNYPSTGVDSTLFEYNNEEKALFVNARFRNKKLVELEII